MREISVRKVEEVVEDLFVKANIELRKDVLSALEELYAEEGQDKAKRMLKVLIDNANIASGENIPICQDTGMSLVFLNIGSEVVFTGGSLNDAINSGVEKAYDKAHLRKSVVADPLLRDNTGTNTPALTHIEITGGDKLEITVMPKGFGSENKGMIKMLNPTAGKEGIIDFCVETVKKAGPDACPPYILGIGIGGTMETCTFLAKKALIREVKSINSKKHIADLEKEIKEKVSALEIGVMGLGGKSTVLGVNIETAPTHIAGLPVAINISCHALRSARAVI